MEKILADSIPFQTAEVIDEFATKGLRTLVFGYRELTAEEYDEFSTLHDECVSRRPLLH